MTGHDPRTGYEESGIATIVDGDDDTPQTVLQIPSDALFSLESVKVEYSDGAATTTQVEVFDDSDGTTSGNVSDRRERVDNVDPDFTETVEGSYRDFEEDVLVQTDGNQDGELVVTVRGTVLTDLRDMVSF